MKPLNTLALLCSVLALLFTTSCKQDEQTPENAADKKAAQKVQPEKVASEAKTAEAKATNNATPGASENAAAATTQKAATTQIAAATEKAPAPAEPTTCGGAAAEGGGCGGCGGGVANKPAEPEAKSKKQHFGGDFTLNEKPLAISTVMTKAADFSGKNVKVSARIAKVCKKKGCWMTLQPADGGDQYVRVTMKDYGFFVPVDCDGKTATVEGTFKSVERPEAQRKHLAEDGGDDPAKVKGAALELTLVATAIDIE